MPSTPRPRRSASSPTPGHWPRSRTTTRTWTGGTTPCSSLSPRTMPAGRSPRRTRPTPRRPPPLPHGPGDGAEPHRHTTVELAVDTDDPSRIAEFWTRALGYRLADNGDVVDPEGRNPTIWFQVTDTPSDNRFHLDRHVPLSSLDDERGRLRPVGGEGDGARHPSFRVFADPEGNRVCLCTEVGHMPGD